jgi:hypothetical protein
MSSCGCPLKKISLNSVVIKDSSLISHFSAYIHAHFRDGFNFRVVVVVGGG